MVLLFAVTSFLNFYDYFTLKYEKETKKGMDLFGGIVMAVLTIVYVVNIVEYFKDQKTGNTGA
jgi:hypothetical protein